MDDEINSFDNTKIAGRISSSLYDLHNCQFTASTFCRPFFFGKERATAERKTGKGEGALDRCANVTKEDNNKQTPKVAFLFRSVRLLARDLLPPSRSPILTRDNLNKSSVHGRGRLVQTKAVIVLLCSCVSFAFLHHIYTMRRGEMC